MDGIPAGVEQETRPREGTASIGRLTVRLVDDDAGTALALVGSSARTDLVLTLSADLAAGTADIASMAVTGTPDAVAYPTGGGTFYIGRETFTYASRSGSTFSTVKRCRYRIEGQGDTYAHTAGDWITPYARFVKTRRAALYATLDATDAGKVTRWLGTVSNVRATGGLTTFQVDLDSGLSLWRPHVHLQQIRGKLAVGVKAGDGGYDGSSAGAVDEGDPATATVNLVLTPSSVTGRTWTVGQRVAFRIGDEYWAGELAADSTITVTGSSNQGRGCFNSPTESHSPGDEVVEVMVLGERSTTSLPELSVPYATSGNPLHLWLMVALSKTGDGSNGTWDVLPFGGVGIDQAFIDATGIASLAASWYPGVRHLEVLEDPAAFLDWSASLLRTVGCYPVQRLDGKLTIKRLAAPVFTTYRTIAATNVSAIPEWEANLDKVVGRLVYKVDYDPGNSSSERGPFRTTYKGEMIGPGLEAQEFYVNNWIEDAIEAKGQWSGLASSPSSFGGGQVTSSDELFFRLYDVWRARFARPWPALSVEALYDSIDIEEGDLAQVSLDHVPNVATGSRGVASQLFEVLRKVPDENRGTVSFTLHQTGYSTLARQWGPAAVVVSAAGSTLTLEAESFSAPGGHDAAGFSLFGVISVWSSDMKTLRASFGPASIGTDSITMAAPVTGYGIVAGDIVVLADYSAQPASVKATWAFMADGPPYQFIDATTPHVFQS